MYGAEQGREKRDVSWTALAPEWSFPSSMAMKMPQRQPWSDGKRSAWRTALCHHRGPCCLLG